jgi:serine acetyltransferase
MTAQAVVLNPFKRLYVSFRSRVSRVHSVVNLRTVFVWKGYGVILLPGVAIQEGATVAASSIVAKEVPKCAIVVGLPPK